MMGGLAVCLRSCNKTDFMHMYIYFSSWLPSQQQIITEGLTHHSFIIAIIYIVYFNLRRLSKRPWDRYRCRRSVKKQDVLFVRSDSATWSLTGISQSVNWPDTDSVVVHVWELLHRRIFTFAECWRSRWCSLNFTRLLYEVQESNADGYFKLSIESVFASLWCHYLKLTWRILTSD